MPKKRTSRLANMNRMMTRPGKKRKLGLDQTAEALVENDVNHLATDSGESREDSAVSEVSWQLASPTGRSSLTPPCTPRIESRDKHFSTQATSHSPLFPSKRFNRDISAESLHSPLPQAPLYYARPSHSLQSTPDGPTEINAARPTALSPSYLLQFMDPVPYDVLKALTDRHFYATSSQSHTLPTNLLAPVTAVSSRDAQAEGVIRRHSHTTLLSVSSREGDHNTTVLSRDIALDVEMGKRGLTIIEGEDDEYARQLFAGAESIRAESDKAGFATRSSAAPNPHPQHLFQPSPSRQSAKLAVDDLEEILRPTRISGKGHKHFSFGTDDNLRRRLEQLRMFLRRYALSSLTWKQAAEETSHMWGPGSIQKQQWKSGHYLSKQLRRWARSFIADRTELPFNLYGTWSVGLLEDQDLVAELQEHLQAVGKYVSAADVVDFMNQSDIQRRYNLSSSITERTARRWMHLLGYRWSKTPKGQYVDGHEREDVVAYRQTRFLPSLVELSHSMRAWRDGVEEARGGPRPERYTVLWYHDESTFYANDRREIRWVLQSEKAVPQPKGEGVSLMIADFMSPDHGYCRMEDGSESARVVFRAGNGAGRDGYFTSEQIINQMEVAARIVQKQYPDEDHIFVYDNAKTHTKRADDALSARNMPMNPSQNFFSSRTVRDPISGKIVYDQNRRALKLPVPMTGAFFPNTNPPQQQDLYFPDDHPEKPGWFKGMTLILRERGINPGNRRRECKDFKCAPGATDCCQRRILFNQPDFAGVESLLEGRARELGIRILFLPKFHPELNPIEQCWGYAKREYRTLPRSTKEADLERNTLASLEKVPLESMRRFATRAERFADGYRHGLDGAEAAWASRHYHSHRVLPQSFIDGLPQWRKEYARKLH